MEYLALLAHYRGEGNKAVHIKEAEALRTSFVYNNKKAMPFENFFTNMQKMFT